MESNFEKSPIITNIKKENNGFIYKPYTDKENLYIPMLYGDRDCFYMVISKEMIKEWLNEK